MANYSNDDNMEYNLDLHRYILTDYALNNELGVSLIDILNNDDAVDDNSTYQWLNRLSRVFYNYLYGYSQDRNLTEYFLSLDKNRQYIFEGMIMLAEAWIINRYDPGVVYSTGKYDSTNYMTIEIVDFVRSCGLATRLLFSNNNDFYESRGVDY